jgi:hypothetical protein
MGLPQFLENSTIHMRDDNPVDLIESLAAEHGWSHDRSEEDEISISITSDWSEYNLSLSWMAEFETLHLGCAFDVSIPKSRQAEVVKLLSCINEQLLMGHFDIWQEDSTIMFRHAMPLSGGAEPTQSQVLALLGSALEACERYYQSFQFVIWSGFDSEQAIKCAHFETMGNA